MQESVESSRGSNEISPLRQLPKTATLFDYLLGIGDGRNWGDVGKKNGDIYLIHNGRPFSQPSAYSPTTQDAYEIVETLKLADSFTMPIPFWTYGDSPADHGYWNEAYEQFQLILEDEASRFSRIATQGYEQTARRSYRQGNAKAYVEFASLGKDAVSPEDWDALNKLVERYLKKEQKSLLQRAFEGDRSIEVVGEMQRLERLCRSTSQANRPPAELCEFVSKYLYGTVEESQEAIVKIFKFKRKVGFVFLSAMNEAEEFVLSFVFLGRNIIALPAFLLQNVKWYEILSGNVYDPLTEQFFARTPRGLRYVFTHLNLSPAELEGIRILFVGNGYSRAPQLINILFGSTGTVATALDLYTKGPLYLRWKTNAVKESALEMKSIADKSQQLTVSTWFMDYFMPKKLGEASEAETIKARLRKLLDELLRVTAVGGEIRFTLASKSLPKTIVNGEGYHYTLDYLRRNKAVKSVTVSQRGMVELVRVELKP